MTGKDWERLVLRFIIFVMFVILGVYIGASFVL